MRMAMSGQMIAQDRHAVHRSSSKHTANGTPWRLNWSRDMAQDLLGACADAERASLAALAVELRSSS